jgi:hypothetical protein
MNHNNTIMESELKNKFTFLLGAGASANAIPVVKDINKKLIEFREKIKGFGSTYIEKLHSNEERMNIKEVVKNATDDLNWLINENLRHATIDTLARKLYLRKDYYDLKKLKAIIDMFFTFKNIFPDKLEMRYDTFLATILNEGEEGMPELPPNVIVLNWNYDFQFELSAFNFYKGASNENDITNILNIYPRRNQPKYFSEKFSIIKLNGTAASLYTNDGGFKIKDYLFLKDITEEKAVIKIIQNYINTIRDDKYESSIFFAWEKGDISNNIRDIAKSAVKDTKILVVIGYSFPTYNRKVDKEILLNMNNLKKIIIQSPEETANNIKYRIKNLISNFDSDSIEIYSSIDEFVIPFEF